MSQVRQKLRRRGPALAFVMLAFFGGVAINKTADSTARQTAHQAALINYQSQLQSCHRGNLLRQEINHRVTDQEAQRQVVVLFISTAEEARQSAYAQTHSKSDLKAARAYAGLARRESKLHDRKVPLVSCTTAIRKP